jgi:hypothetical protein
VSRTIILVGTMLLASSLIARVVEQTDLSLVVMWAGGWLGSILVVVGTGKLFFLDGHD